MVDATPSGDGADDGRVLLQVPSPKLPPSMAEPVELPIRIYLLTGILCLVNFSVGFSMSIIAPALIFIEADLRANLAEISAIVSFALLGGLLGSVLSGVMSDAVGRRKTLELGTLMMAVSGFGCAFSQSAWQLVIARFVQGFGTSISVVVAGIVLTELAPTRIRWTVGSTSQNFVQRPSVMHI
jgi:MFS family permease